jgi:hypothetical protein
VLALSHSCMAMLLPMAATTAMVRLAIVMTSLASLHRLTSLAGNIRLDGIQRMSGRLRMAGRRMEFRSAEQ